MNNRDFRRAVALVKAFQSPRRRGPRAADYRNQTVVVDSGLGKQIAEYVRTERYRGETIGVYRTTIRNVYTGRLYTTHHYRVLRGGRLLWAKPSHMMN